MTSEGNGITYGAAISSCEMLAEFPACVGGSEREIWPVRDCLLVLYQVDCF